MIVVRTCGAATDVADAVVTMEWLLALLLMRSQDAFEKREEEAQELLGVKGPSQAVLEAMLLVSSSAVCLFLALTDLLP